MKRWTVVLALLAASQLSATSAQAFERPQPGFGKSQYGVKVIYRGPGYVKYRYTYPGYVNGFPPPAMYTYGYPLSGYSYGVGF